LFIITLTLTEQKTKAPEYMAAHNAWIAKGFEEGVFLMVGSLKPQGGGAILASDADLASIQSRVADDPFVSQGIAIPHIQEVAPGRTDPRLSFLDAKAA
jgi:uncharacterized protein YciI